MITGSGHVHTGVVTTGPAKALFLHCGLGSHHMLKPLAKALKGHHTILMDLLGHGRSDRGGRGSCLADNAAAAASVFDGPGLVFGHSFGGVAALRFALDHPGRVRALVLFEPVLFAAGKGMPSFAENMEQLALLTEGFEIEDDEAATKAFVGLWGDGTPWEDLTPLARSQMVDRIFIAKETRGDLEQDTTNILAAGALEALDCPTLLLRGDQSPAVIADVLSGLSSRLPKSAEIVLIGEGHMAPAQNPSRIATHMNDWLAKQ